jgi:protein TonB
VENKVRRLRSLISISVTLLVVVLLAFSLYSPHAFAQDHSQRRVRSRVYPEYPEIARKMSLTGVVKLEVVVSPTGTVKDTKVIGGHPILVTAALDAVKKWRFDPSGAETTETVEFKFDPGN